MALLLVPPWKHVIRFSQSGDEAAAKASDDVFIPPAFFCPQLRYHKCLVARPPSQKACSASPPADSVTRRVSTSVKRGVLSLIDTLKQKRPIQELPQ